jgi:5'-deoxynucleotidase YfbR-like HD superfamily hydrolase
VTVMKRYSDEAVARLETLYESGAVKRMHTVPTVCHHDIAGHVYGSLLIGVELCRYNEVPTQNVMLALLYHDAAEVDTGDIPAPVKRRSLSITEALEGMEEEFASEVGHHNPILIPFESDIIKAADTLDLMFKCVIERRMGNRHPRLTIVMHNVLKYIQAQQHVKGVGMIAMHLASQWRSYGGE